MMRYLTLLIVPFFASSLFGQVVFPGIMTSELIAFDPAQLSGRHVKSISVAPATPGQHTRQITYTIEFTEGAQLARIIKLRAADTSLIKTYFYSKDGMLAWEITRDFDWNRTTKSAYRFNSDSSLFQIKSYELLKNDEAMFVGSQQFIYQGSSQPRLIRYFDGTRLTKSVYLTYDAQMRKTSERSVDEKGALLEQTDFDYDQAGRLVKVAVSGNISQETRITYHTSGLMARMESWEDNKLKEAFDYEYSTDGLLTRIVRQLAGESPAQATAQKVDYSLF